MNENNEPDPLTILERDHFANDVIVCVHWKNLCWIRINLRVDLANNPAMLIRMICSTVMVDLAVAMEPCQAAIEIGAKHF